MLLFLSDVAGSEVILILLVILIFFGPKSIPGIAKTFGKTIYQIKQASDDLKSEMTKTGMDIKKEMNFDKILKDASDKIEKEVAPLKEEINEVETTLNSTAYVPKAKRNQVVEEQQVNEHESSNVEPMNQPKVDSENQDSTNSL